MHVSWKFVSRLGTFRHVYNFEAFSDKDEGKMLGMATHGRKMMELLHDMMEERDYGQLKDLISDRWTWRQDSKWECMSETCWKEQKTKEEVINWVTYFLGNAEYPASLL